MFARLNNCVLAIFGDIKPADAREAVEKAFGKMAGGDETSDCL